MVIITNMQPNNNFFEMCEIIEAIEGKKIRIIAKMILINPIFGKIMKDKCKWCECSFPRIIRTILELSPKEVMNAFIIEEIVKSGRDINKMEERYFRFYPKRVIKVFIKDAIDNKNIDAIKKIYLDLEMRKHLNVEKNGYSSVIKKCVNDEKLLLQITKKIIINDSEIIPGQLMGFFEFSVENDLESVWKCILTSEKMKLAKWNKEFYFSYFDHRKLRIKIDTIGEILNMEQYYPLNTSSFEFFVIDLLKTSLSNNLDNIVEIILKRAIRMMEHGNSSDFDAFICSDTYFHIALEQYFDNFDNFNCLWEELLEIIPTNIGLFKCLQCPEIGSIIDKKRGENPEKCLKFFKILLGKYKKNLDYPNISIDQYKSLRDIIDITCLPFLSGELVTNSDMIDDIDNSVIFRTKKAQILKIFEMDKKKKEYILMLSGEEISKIYEIVFCIFERAAKKDSIIQNCLNVPNVFEKIAKFFQKAIMNGCADIFIEHKNMDSLEIIVIFMIKNNFNPECLSILKKYCNHRLFTQITSSFVRHDSEPSPANLDFMFKIFDNCPVDNKFDKLQIETICDLMVKKTCNNNFITPKNEKIIDKLIQLIQTILSIDIDLGKSEESYKHNFDKLLFTIEGLFNLFYDL